ncbi:vacuolar protein sorting-associated protein 37A-like [Amphibalanus amphitrite]|uniref:vacuolar protein sorting-associated protein 37A-like n=1 Tax=Amphibalanus amphitrite TaxID=1232801 RepID=UPI001C90DED9|nr:vacuolar protein sorting-associated protein 37A-like [Amphibalanus amphitrite]XP_043221881.1 vacuolar protein sorting-associated protein 37A-like [Amphibalanus amphitrite]
MFKSIFGRDSPDVSRAKQIKTLRIYNKEVSEVTHNQEYRVSFSVDGVGYSISVYLPPGYPDERPLLQVSPPVQHPWVDAGQQVVAAPGIVNYTKHCDLGQLVQNIVHELERSLSGAGASAAPAGFSPGLYPAAGPSVPQAELDFPELSKLSQEELEALLGDEDRLEELVEGLPQVKPLLDDLQATMDRVEKLVGDTLSAAPRLAERQQAVESSREAVRAELTRFEAGERRREQLAERYAPAHLERLLEIAAAEAEECSDRLAERLSAGEIDVDSFVKQFMHQRTLCHTRRAKQERLHAQLRELDLSWAS